MYSIMLYMKTRVTFRVASDLADALRDLPNQTVFVEQALRSALGRTCPACDGQGRVQWKSVSVSDFKRASLPRLDRKVKPLTSSACDIHTIHSCIQQIVQKSKRNWFI